MGEYLNAYADKMFSEGFENAYYIGRHQIFQEDERGPHKFYYIGYQDTFGVRIPAPRNRFEVQIWGMRWTLGRSEKLDKAIANALKGKFTEVRHNIRLAKRAKSHGEEFVEATWRHPKKAAAKKAGEKLPIRGRRHRRRRRKLLI